MGKRANQGDGDEDRALKAGERPQNEDAPAEAGQFEDDFEDEFESEDEIMEAGVDGGPDDEQDAGGM